MNVAKLNRTRKTSPKPLEAFIAHKADIDLALARLKQRSDEHFSKKPDDITWSDVGDLAHYAEQLKEITDAVFKEGEYANG